MSQQRSLKDLEFEGAFAVEFGLPNMGFKELKFGTNIDTDSHNLEDFLEHLCE